MTRRFWVSVALSAPLLVVAMGDMLPGRLIERMVGATVSAWLQLVLASPVVLWGGWSVFVRGRQSVVHRSPNMFTLISLGVAMAFIESVLATVAPQLFPAAFRMQGGHVAAYFEASAVVITLMLLGQVLELRARGRTSSAIRGLLGLSPKPARRLRADNTEEDVALDQIVAGDLLRVRPREKVPVDGLVTEGRSALDESMVTGEPIPSEKQTGDHVNHVIGATISERARS